MNKLRSRVAVGPLRRPLPMPVPAVPAVDQLIAELRPVEPVYCIRPAILEATAARFVADFPGDVLYAVKCNPEPTVLRALWRGGVRHFDCASPQEVRLVRDMFPDADIHFMHPVKARGAIRVSLFHRQFVVCFRWLVTSIFPFCSPTQQRSRTAKRHSP